MELIHKIWSHKDMQIMIKSIVILLILNIPFYIALGSIIWESLDDFKQALKYYLIPNWISMIRGKYVDDVWETNKLILFIGISIAVVISEYALLNKHFHSLLVKITSLI